MSERLCDIVEFRGDRLFNGAVNIGWFGSDAVRTRAAVEAFVFHGPAYHGVSQDDVGITHGHRLQDTASFTRSVVRRCYGIEDQPFTLAIAGYGTGKSHLAITLASLLKNPNKEVAESVISGIDKADRAIGTEIKTIFGEAQQPCLVIALNGMQSFDLTAEITKQILQQVKEANLNTRPLDELRPRFAQASSLIKIAVTNSEVVDELLESCEVTSIEDILYQLEQQDEYIYGRVHETLAARSIIIKALGGESVRDVIDVACREYCGPGKPFKCMIVLFDEFGRYTEFATVRSHIAGSGVLQDLFEGIQFNAGMACFAGFIQFDLNAYVQRVAPEHRNEILRYVTRYQSAHRVYLSINLETLIASLIEKKQPARLARRFDNDTAKEESEDILSNLQRWYPQSENHRLWNSPEMFHSVVRKGCWPLSAYSTWFLFHLAAAGKHLQERSALALLGDVFNRFCDNEVDKNEAWCIVPVDLWSDSLQHELITSEEGGQQGSITHAYASVIARHGAQLDVELRRLLQAIVLASKMGLNANDKDDAIEALSELAGLQLTGADSGIQQLQNEYNVIEWDESFKEFDILGDAVPRTQFLSFIRQQVANTYDESSKAALFASKAALWCDILSDIECDFAEENKITTREWRYAGVTSNLDVLAMQVKLASDRWAKALAVDEPRGTIIYCYVEPNRNHEQIVADTRKLLRNAVKQSDITALPILVILLCDKDGTLGQSLAELAILDEAISEEDRVRFGNLIPAHQEKMRGVMRSKVESMIKDRLYITSLKEPLESQRLAKAGTELFSRIYSSPLVFPFDGFTTAKGNAADSCQQLTVDLLTGKLDYDTVMAKPVKVKNRALSVLQNAWGVFTEDGKIRSRPSTQIVRNLTMQWDEMLKSEEGYLKIQDEIYRLCMPPYGANIASAGLFLGVFICSRIDNLSIIRDGNPISIIDWIGDGVFRGKFLDLAALREFTLVLTGETSSEWEALLDEWEQAESHLLKKDFLTRANALQKRASIPPSLKYREIRLRERSSYAIEALKKLDDDLNQGRQKIETGRAKGNVGTIAWGASMLLDTITSMENESPLWTEEQITEPKPWVDESRQSIIQVFSEWLKNQTPRDGMPDTVGAFKHNMLHNVGGSLQKLGLDDLYDQIEKHTDEVVKRIETISSAKQTCREIKLWLTAHGDATKFIRIAELRELRKVGKEFLTKLQDISTRLDMPTIKKSITELSDTLTKMKTAEDELINHTSKIWDTKLESIDGIEKLMDDVEALTSAFENCPQDLDDLQLMRRALRIYEKIYHQLDDELLTDSEFEKLSIKLLNEAQNSLNDEEPPWLPDETIAYFISEIAEKRKKISKEWIEALEKELGKLEKMSISEANILYSRVEAPPALLTVDDEKKRKRIRGEIENRLDNLKVEWLLEKFKELTKPLKQKFLLLVKNITVKEQQK